MNIALLCGTFGALGGVAQIAEDLAVEFARTGHCVAIVSIPHKGLSVVRRQTPAVEQVFIDLPRTKPFSFTLP